MYHRSDISDGKEPKLLGWDLTRRRLDAPVAGAVTRTGSECVVEEHEA